MDNHDTDDSASVAVQEEHNNLPARVSIVSLPDKTELRAKSLFSVHEVHMHWQEQGKYLAVHVCPLCCCIGAANCSILKL